MNSPDIGEKAVSKAAEIGLESQLDEADNLDVNIRTEATDLMQGDVESVSVKGDGLVMQKELRADKLQIETNSISIDPLKAAMGDIELKSSTDARMLVVLKEEDVQRAFNSEYVKDKLQKLDINYKGKTEKLDIDQVNFTLPEKDKVKLDAKLKIAGEAVEKVSFTAAPKVNSAGNSIKLESVEYDRDSEYNQDVASAIIESAEEILDLRNFELDEMSLQVRKLNVSTGKLTIEADAVIKDFPNS